LEGSIRKYEDQVRITAQLIDALKGYHLWAERYDRDLKDIFKLQDEISQKIITALEVKLTVGEQARMWAKGTSNLDAYLKLLKAREYILRFNKESNVMARQLAKEAIDLDPQYALGYTTLGATNMFDVFFKTTNSPKQSIAKAIGLVKKSISIDESVGKARGLLGFLYTMIGQHEKGILEAEKGVSLEPNSDLAHNYLGLTLRFASRPKEAIPVIKEAIRLNPFAQSIYLFNLGLSYLNSGQYEEAIAECKKATLRDPNNLVARLALTAAYSVSGREEDARASAAEVLRIDPKFSAEYYSKTLPYKNQADRELFFNGLRKAGLK
jgi:adenylate cyclase